MCYHVSVDVLLKWFLHALGRRGLETRRLEWKKILEDGARGVNVFSEGVRRSRQRKASTTGMAGLDTKQLGCA